MPCSLLLFPLPAALSGRAFTLVNHSIRSYRPLYLLGHFCSERWVYDRSSLCSSVSDGLQQR